MSRKVQLTPSHALVVHGDVKLKRCVDMAHTLLSGSFMSIDQLERAQNLSAVTKDRHTGDYFAIVMVRVPYEVHLYVERIVGDEEKARVAHRAMCDRLIAKGVLQPADEVFVDSSGATGPIHKA